MKTPLNWLRMHLRIWLRIEWIELVQSNNEMGNRQKIATCYQMLGEDRQKLEQQQREICALRGEIAMLKADGNEQLRFARERHLPTNEEEYARYQAWLKRESSRPFRRNYFAMDAHERRAVREELEAQAIHIPVVEQPVEAFAAQSQPCEK